MRVPTQIERGSCGVVVRTLVAATLATTLTFGCAETPSETEAPVRPVKLLTVGAGDDAGRRQYPATLSPAIDAMLGFEVAGRILELPVDEGQSVAPGDVLARIDARDYEARLAAARAQVRKSEADLRRALAVRREDAGAISMAMIDSYRRSVEVARAEEATAKKAVEDATLRAPFGGRVARRMVERYANVQAKEPVVNLQDDSVIEAVVNLPERDLATIEPPEGGKDVATERFRPEVTIPATGRTYPAKIWEFATTADPATRTFKLTLRFDTPDGVVLLPGMTGQVSLALGGPRGAGGVLRVPAHAVVTGPEREAFVWVVDPDTMIAHRRPVRVGRVVSDEIEILEGLRPGETIATAGVHQLRDGLAVRRIES